MRRAQVVCWLLGLSLTLGWAGTALAEDEGHKKDKGGHKKGKHKPVYVHDGKTYDLDKEADKKALFQMLTDGDVHKLEQKHDEPSFAERLADQAIWTILVFGAMLLILWKYAWGPIKEGLHKREETIQKAIDEAHLAREETRKLEAALAAEKARGNEEVRVMMEKARKDAEQLKADIQAQGKAEVQADRDRLRREVDTAKDQAIQEIWGQAAQLATLISNKAIKRHLTYEDHHALLDEALAEFRTAGRARMDEYERARA
jgi:F-type H+-transporting ATPase subunit b